jgi:hypothetical protein
MIGVFSGKLGGEGLGVGHCWIGVGFPVYSGAGLQGERERERELTSSHRSDRMSLSSLGKCMGSRPVAVPAVCVMGVLMPSALLVIDHRVCTYLQCTIEPCRDVWWWHFPLTAVRLCE